MSHDIPRVYMACLASYNAGTLHGAWIDCDGSADIGEEIRAMIAESREPYSEEWEIHDHECWQGLDPACIDLADLAEWGEALAESDGPLGAFVSNMGLDCYDNATEALQAFEEADRGEWDSLEDYAVQMSEDMGQVVPDWLTHYVDFRAMGRDLELNGDVWTLHSGNGSGVRVFANI